MTHPFDADTLAWIEQVEGESTPMGASIQAMRAAYEASRKAAHRGRPAGLRVEDVTLAGCPARRYHAGTRGRVLFFHGGGYVLGSLDSHDDACAPLAVGAQCEVIALDYRLAPEHPFPAAYEDALAAAMALNGPFVLAGDSAGGTLAAGVALALRETGNVVGQVLIYPALGGAALDLPSYREKADARLLTTNDMRWYAEQWGAPPDDPRAAPLLAEDVRGVAPCIAFAAAEDPLRDDAVAWVARLRAAGISAQAHIEEGLPHGYLFARHDSAMAAAAFTRVVEAISGFAAASEP